MKKMPTIINQIVKQPGLYHFKTLHSNYRDGEVHINYDEDLVILYEPEPDFMPHDLGLVQAISEHFDEPLTKQYLQYYTENNYLTADNLVLNDRKLFVGDDDDQLNTKLLDNRDFDRVIVVQFNNDAKVPYQFLGIFDEHNEANQLMFSQALKAAFLAQFKADDAKDKYDQVFKQVKTLSKADKQKLIQALIK